MPASCPYVTAVGATSVHDPETTTTAFPSGGGFPNIFPRPSWREAHVSYISRCIGQRVSWLFRNIASLPAPDWTSLHGSFPNVVAFDGKAALSGGNSASVPIFAPVIVSVNDARLAIGKSAIG
ncbi:hypothetical protein BD309DRAFT_992032 [Dichomitus squalens]|uniref:Uncharacterized protein n=1 Tax=Dichomitus squalens TaxID=114155 RepID=A0A4Q9NKP6_9APHY|nr:hypothetical protein BD309DRAFT_992032 [Dichomitus squalens]TBU62751.1 hypothetical protein BD310DRAFT_945623 [Dichomitus squalens]